jgi:tetratricopeptide (TPR) repeat protein
VQGELAEARERLRKALDHEERFPAAHLGLGHIAMATGRFQVALDHYRKAGDGYQGLGRSLIPYRQRRYTRVQDRLRRMERTLEQIEAGAAADGRREALLARMRNQIHQLRAVQPPSAYDDPSTVPAEVFFYLGGAYFQLGRLERAEQAWTQCADRHPKLAMVHNNLAVLHAKQRETRAALRHLEKAQSLGYRVDPQFMADLRQAVVRGSQ